MVSSAGKEYAAGIGVVDKLSTEMAVRKWLMDLAGKRVLTRVDINVPVRGGGVTDSSASAWSWPAVSPLWGA